MKHPEYRLKVEPLVNTEDFQKYIKGKIESIRFVKYDIPSDLAESFEDGNKGVEGRVELVFTARRGKHLPVASKFRQLLGDGPSAQIMALKEIDFEYDSVKLKSRVGGVLRTVDLAAPSHLRSYHDISAEVSRDSSGHPNFESIHGLATGLLEQINAKMTPKVKA